MLGSSFWERPLSSDIFGVFTVVSLVDMEGWRLRSLKLAFFCFGVEFDSLL